MLHNGCTKQYWDGCLAREAYVLYHTALDIFSLEDQFPESTAKV
jgi:hypothetical protein